MKSEEQVAYSKAYMIWRLGRLKDCRENKDLFEDELEKITQDIKTIFGYKTEEESDGKE